MRRFAVLFISILSILPNTSFACGGGWYDADYDNIYLIDFMLDGGTLGHNYHNSRQDFAGDAVGDNLEEWYTFFDGKYSKETIASWIYTEEDYADVPKITRELSSTAPKKRNAFVDYITIAKKAETIANAYDPWAYYGDKEPSKNFGLINKLTKDIISKMALVNDAFIKERYNFQLTKLYYYGERYSKAVETYDAFYNKSSSTSIMRYWALDYKAGSQMQSGDTIVANYNFLQVFDNYPGRRDKSYHSMIFSDEEQFYQTLDLCKTDQEKASFYYVRGVNKHSVVLEDLKACFLNAPNSEYARVLMVNELVKMEHIVWYREEQNYPWDDDVERMPTDQIHAYIEDFIDFAKMTTDKAKDKDFWNISLAYLYSLHDDYQKSANLLDNVKTSNHLYSKQIEAIQLLNYVHLHPNLSTTEENQLGQMWYDYNDGAASLDKSVWGSTGSINSYIAEYLEKYYEEKVPVMAFLFSGQTLTDFNVEYSEKLDVRKVQELRRQLSLSDKTTLQKFGEDNFLSGSYFPNIVNGMMEVEATLLMRNPETLEGAIALFEKLDSTRKIKTNPFNMDIHDCIWGDWYGENSCNHKTGNYTKLSLAQKLLEMKNLAENKQSAMDYYLLGNAYYNMSYFGHAYGALSYFRSGNSFTGFDDCTVALDFYEKAIPLFKDNREMQAKANFMAAKCEQNNYFLEEDASSEYGYWGIDVDYENPKEGIIAYNAEIEEAGYRKHFEILKDDYRDTKFYKEIIRECSYFDIYVHY